MTATSSTSRRTLLLSTFTGILAGGTWGAAIQILATPSTPNMSIIGTGTAQIVLLNTTRIRVLILLGTPNGRLLAQLPALLTMLHQRIDIVVGTPAAFGVLGPGFHGRWRVRHRFLLPEEHETGMNTRDQTWITGDVGADLGNSVSIRMSVTPRNAWDLEAASRNLWMVTINSGTNLVALVPDQSSVRAHAPDGATLLVIPQADVERMIDARAPASIATNARDDLSAPAMEGTAAMLIRIFPEDIARFELRDDGVALPTWAEGPA